MKTNTSTMPDTISKSLLCKLTDEERKDFGIKLATTLEEVQRVEEEKKRKADHYKDRIGGLQATADELRRKVSTGQEWRDVECVVILDEPAKGIKSISRTDTGEVIETKPMTDADKQLQLDLETGSREEKDAVIDNIVEIDAERVDDSEKQPGDAPAGDDY
jgi:ABC-type molybdenum transport system ATPase subunit/photorepair protein PhrA